MNETTMIMLKGFRTLCSHDVMALGFLVCSASGGKLKPKPDSTLLLPIRMLRNVFSFP